MANRLADQTSPYLLQHAQNPVDWYPWGPEALERAQRENKPVFLSIGYSACHWCHVMEHESFEDPQIAAFLNEHFVPIKVDREERPDLDQIYMNAVQLMTGRGGWPMSVFLTPALKPFYGGTYWPPAARMGMPGFIQVLSAVADAWANRRAMALEQADSLTDHLQSLASPQAAPGQPRMTLLETALATLERDFDPAHGGFGGAPKFPHPMDLRLILHLWHRNRDENALRMATTTLDKIAAGGIYDQLGGGFHRYSVDERWLVPHFEKMLYDNALLVPCYVEAYLITRNTEYARIARETCDYVLREMTDAGGGFYSTQDADSEGEEGKFFVWTPGTVEAILGTEPARVFNFVFDVTSEGNFEHGQSILNRPKSLDECARVLGREAGELERELQASRARLLAARDERVHPGLDDKVLVSWNGLMIEALTLAAGALDEPRYLVAAQRAADFILRSMRRADGGLLHSWRRGQARLDAYLDDYAALAGALVSLYEADFDERWIDESLGLCDAMLDRFVDSRQGGFFFTATDHESLITRQKDLYDGAAPSGNSLAACALLRLAGLTGRGDLLTAAESTLRFATGLIEQSPRASAQMLLAIDFYLGPTPQIVLIGNPREGETAAALAALAHRFVPNRLVACRAAERLGAGSSALAQAFAGKSLDGPEPAVFICKDFACEVPLFGKERASAAWDLLAGDRAGPGSR